jgi:cytochrome P450
MPGYETEFAAPIHAGPAPPGKPLPFLKYLRTIGENVIAGYDEAVYEEWILRRGFPGTTHYIVNDPAGIKRVLVDNTANYVKGEMEHRVSGLGMSGEDAAKVDKAWRARRRIVSTSLDYRSYPAFSLTVSESTLKVLAAWEALPPGTAVDVPRTMQELTCEVMARVLFSGDEKEVAGALEQMIAQGAGPARLDPVDFVPLLNRVRRSYRGRAALRRFQPGSKAIDGVIERRMREGNGEKRDLLDRLISARDQQNGQRMEVEELRLITTALFAGGHDAPARALAWTWCLLSQHPIMERRLHDELDAVLGGRRPGFEDVDKLTYTRMVIEEAMRLYPSFPLLAWREAINDDEICGMAIPKGGTVAIVPWVVHRHRRLWENPDCFDPERFSPLRSAGRPQLAYLPFGAGPRVCMGSVFAMMEMVLILATIAQRYRLRLLPGHKVEPRASLVLGAKDGLRMTLEEREKATR